MTAFFEDCVVGTRVALGSWRFTAEEIVRFARAYDPQRFHISEEEAAKTHFGRLCASGWHTAGVYMKLMVRERQASAAAAQARGERVGRVGGSPGFKDLRWLKPVYVDDVISYESTIISKRLSGSAPDWGLVTFLNEGANQAGEKVFEFKGTVFFERREKGG